MFVFLRDVQNTHTILTLLTGLVILLRGISDGNDFFALLISLGIDVRLIKQRIETFSTHQNAKIRSKSSLLLSLLQFAEVIFVNFLLKHFKLCIYIDDDDYFFLVATTIVFDHRLR